MDNSVLDDVVNLIETSPRSGQALLLFALVKTLNMPRGGHMYMLKKLQEMEPDTRRLAYGLMEMMATGSNQDEEWINAVQRMEEGITGRRYQ